MKIHEVENMGVEELSSKTDEIALQLVGTDSDVLALRYVQARLDAKIRDVKLAEQAETLKALQEGIEAIKEREVTVAAAGLKAVQDLQCRIGQAESDAHSSAVEADCVIAERVATIDSLTSQVASQGTEIGRLDDAISRLTEQANKYSEAVSTAQKVLLDAINSKLLADAG